MRFLITLLILLLGESYACAQTFTDRLRRQNKHEGSVIIYQETYLTQLLNGKTPGKNGHSEQKEKQESSAAAAHTTKPQNKNRQTQTPPPAHLSNRVTVVKENDSSATHTTQTQKKVFRNSITAQGYRIRLYVGGSSREARQKAYSAGYLFKSIYTDVPVYTHFYSPHWMCSAGNFRTHEEAAKFLTELKATGQFEGAMIVKSKIQIEQ